MSGKIKKNNKKINVTFFAGYVGIYLFITVLEILRGDFQIVLILG